jgi:Ca2+-binding RTX toxin-like protein
MHCESLESRRLFAFTVVGYGTTLYFTGTSGNDELNAWISPSGTQIEVDLDGDYAWDVYYARADVTNVEVECDDGNDDVYFAFGLTEDCWVDGGGGYDTIRTADGDDTIYGSADGDEIHAGLGADWIDGERGDDDIWGEDGRDTIFGHDGNDSVHGGSHKDSIEGGDGADSLRGEDGDDTVKGNANDDSLWGGEGDDSLDGGWGADFIRGDAGNDTASGGLGNDDVVE